MKKILLIIFSFFTVLFLLFHIQKTQASSVQSMPLISRNVPVYANNPVYPASYANDTNYDTYAMINTNSWLAYDLSSVPASHRTTVVVAWYNDAMTYEYDHTIDSTPGYNNIGGYTIDVNAAPGGSAPTSGWVTLATVTGNHYHSRQHVINMTGYNWVRINVTASDGSSGNTDAGFNMDVHDASQGVTDDWIFYGDSITANILHHQQINNTGNFSQLINTSNSGYFPLQEDGGIPYLTSSDGASHLAAWLQLFPGKFVGLSYGTNDANGCMDPNTFKQNYTVMIQSVIILGKIPVIPHIPWAPSSNVQRCAPALNAAIDQLYANNPQIIKGPDLWNVFLNHSELFQDQLHPNAAGEVIFRNAWANSMTQEVYNGSVTSGNPTAVPTVTPAPSLTQTVSNSPTPQTVTSGLHVSGNKLVDQQGKQVILRGVNRSGTEYACIQGWGIFDGPNVTNDDASISPMKSWGINQVNVGLNEDCWLGINGVPAAYGGSNYQQAIIHYVQTIENNGMYPVISLFWNAPGTTQATGQHSMPDADHSTAFWQSVANTFKSDNKVLLRIKEEPYPANNSDTVAAWQCWLNGGNSCNEGYPVVGMQSLITTIRAAGATNVIQVPGIQYANNLDQFLTYKPTDPLNNLMAVADEYPGGNGANDTSFCHDTTCYNSQFAPIIAQMPFMLGEFGESVNGDVCSTVASDALMNWMDQHNSGYSAWTWDTWGTSCGDLSLITNYNGTPHSPNGVDYKAHLATVLSGTTPPPSCTTSVPSGTGVATFNSVTLPSAGTYNIFTRMLVPQTGNSVYLQVDNSCPVMVSDSTSINTWDWVPSGTLAYTANSTHTITLYGKDQNVKVDEVLLSQSCVPTGDGSNCTSAAITATPTLTSLSPTRTPTATVTSTITATPKATPTVTVIPTKLPSTTITPLPTRSGSGSLTYINSSSANGNFGAGVSISIPSGIQAGDLLIAATGTNGQSATWTTPVGWNMGAGSNTTSTQGLHWYWKIANGTENGTKVVLKSSLYADGGGIVAAYRGATATSPITGVSSLVTSDNGGSGHVKAASVNGVSLSTNENVVSLILASWQPSAATISWPTGFADEARATDGYGYIEIGESLSSILSNNLPSQTLNFSVAQAVIQTLQIAVLVK